MFCKKTTIDVYIMLIFSFGLEDARINFKEGKFLSTPTGCSVYKKNAVLKYILT